MRTTSPGCQRQEEKPVNMIEMIRFLRRPLDVGKRFTPTRLLMDPTWILLA